MHKDDLQALIALPIILAVGGILAWTGSQGGAQFANWPVYALCMALAFGLQWLAFVPAFLAQSEKYYDLVGSLSYLSVLAMALLLSPTGNTRAILLGLWIGIWAIRLGSFLYLRIRATGEDSRFDELKPHFFRFLMAWTLQGLWICFSLAAALAAITSPAVPLDLWAAMGSAVWLIGFAIEAISDEQKRRFRNDPKRNGFIHSGLWAWSRHPNYFGEIVLWIGIALIALPTLKGWQYLSLISPVFITLLLTKISGVPLLEAKSDQRWGGQADYEAYKARTPVLIPRPPSTK